MPASFAPDVLRQRLLIEGYYRRAKVDEKVIRAFFNDITSKLDLRVYGEPIIFSPGGEGKEDNQGYDAFIPLIDSGICLYVWTGKKFVSSIIYTCKNLTKLWRQRHLKNSLISAKWMLNPFRRSNFI
jgi:S-adenosylmethionine decarboxylase